MESTINSKMVIRFFFWGCLSALIYFGSYFILISYFSLSPLISSLAAFLISVGASFFFNSRFVFLKRKGSFIKFVAIAVNGLILNLLIIFFFTKVIILNELIAGLIVVVAVPIHNFILNILLNFKKINDV